MNSRIETFTTYTKKILESDGQYEYYQLHQKIIHTITPLEFVEVLGHFVYSTEQVSTHIGKLLNAFGKGFVQFEIPVIQKNSLLFKLRLENYELLDHINLVKEVVKSRTYVGNETLLNIIHFLDQYETHDQELLELLEEYVLQKDKFNGIYILLKYIHELKNLLAFIKNEIEDTDDYEKRISKMFFMLQGYYTIQEQIVIPILLLEEPSLAGL